MSRSLWDEIRQQLASVPGSSPAGGSWRRAAVLVPLYESGGQVFVLLTRRTEAVEYHKGQISFPGGAADDDEDPRETALRETFEEVGIPADRIEVLGRLPDVDVTVSGFRVTPYVGVIPHPYPLQPSAEEIAEVLLVPLVVFRDSANLRVELREQDGRHYDVYHYSYGRHTIWGATARIIKHLVDVLDAKA